MTQTNGGHPMTEPNPRPAADGPADLEQGRLTRRSFLGGVTLMVVSALGLATLRPGGARGGTLTVGGNELAESLVKQLPAGYKVEDHYWGFLVDTTKCIGCGSCVRACKAENEVPDGYFRTWVERYEITDRRKVTVDSPDGALHGFARDHVTGEKIEKAFFVPKLCNHCETSACTQVCPVGATFFTRDGIQLVDRTHCIGCSYCVQACPYGSRYVDHTKGYADKCTLCYHRITRGLDTACVQACPMGARVAGNLKDSDSPLRRLLAQNRFMVLKEDMGTHPKCFYIGLEQEVK